jgi:3-phenylpropionate/trans-cinnamate dioxygenase ferredoxin subunit
MAGTVTVGKTSDFKPGQMKSFNVKGKRILVANVGGTFFATQDVCTHDNGTLSDGELIGDEIECPRHGARFSAQTGQVRALPAMLPIKTFPVKIENAEIQVTLE